MTDQDDLLTVRDVARACKRSEETVRRWIWSGKLQARKLGNQMFVKRTDLEAMQVPRAGETKAAYGRLGYEPIEPFTKEEFDEWLTRVKTMRAEIVKKYGPSDVTELLREIREEDE